MKVNSKLKTGAGAVIAIALAIQFVPVERTNPAVIQEVLWDSQQSQTLAQNSCYDCHSNETVWPWYSYVAPMSWLVTKDVVEGREHLNFSMWHEPNEDLDHIIEMIQDGEMPPREYLALHPEARLDDQSREVLIRGMRATLLADPPVPAEDHGDDEHDDEPEHDDPSER